MRLSELQNKNIVNILDGKNIGNIIDVEIDSKNGSINSFIIEPNKNFLSFLNRGGKDTEIKWNTIAKIGEDVILVKITL